MKYTSIQNKELVISHIDSNVSIPKLILELYETYNSTECYFNSDIWLNFLCELCEYTNVNTFVYFGDLDLLRKYEDLWVKYFYIADYRVYTNNFIIDVPCLYLKFPRKKNEILNCNNWEIYTENPERYFKYWLLFLNRKRKDLNTLHELKNYTNIMLNVIDNVNYLQNLHEIKWKDKLTTVDKYLSYSQLSTKYLHGKTLREQIIIVGEIKSYVKKYGDKVIKLLEDSPKFETFNDDGISNLILSDLIKNHKSMCKPLLNHPILKGGWICVELNTHVDLFNETEHQGNCIGGTHFNHYRSRIEKGQLRAFSFRKDDIWITITFKKVGIKWIVDEKQATKKTKAQIYNNDYEKSIFDVNCEIVIKCLNAEKLNIEDDF